MKLQAFLVFSVYVSLWGLFSLTEGAKIWSGEAKATAIQGESVTLVWNVTLTGSDVNKGWTYVKILHAEGANTDELVTFKNKGKTIIIDNPSYNLSRPSDFTFNVSQSGPSVTIRFTMANLVRTTDMKSYKAQLGFSDDASTYPDLTTLTILVKPYSMNLKIMPEKNTFCFGDKANITCRADGIPTAQISVRLKNHLIQSENASVTLTLSLNGTGENNLSCVANNTAGIGQKNITINVKEPPNIVQCRINNEEVTNKSVNEGTKVTLSCQVTGSEPLSIKWTKKDNEQTSLSQKNTLTFGSISRRDSSQYRVTAYNGRECKIVTKILNVTVMCKKPASERESDGTPDSTATTRNAEHHDSTEGAPARNDVEALIGTPEAGPHSTGKKRKPPHCKKCGKPMKGHKKELCGRNNSLQDERKISIDRPEFEIKPDGTTTFRAEKMDISAEICQGSVPLLSIGTCADKEEIGSTVTDEIDQ